MVPLQRGISINNRLSDDVNKRLQKVLEKKKMPFQIIKKKDDDTISEDPNNPRSFNEPPKKRGRKKEDDEFYF